MRLENRQERKYGAILIDPPWHFRTYDKRHDALPSRATPSHYGTMGNKDIVALPVADLAAKDCALFMWVVDSHLDVAFRCFDAWGFQFKTRAFTWFKGTIGMGYWTRKQTEICLLATRGHPRRKSKGVREVIDQPRREHSRKPNETYNRIEALVDGPYLEMFARQTAPGWDSWGNEAGKFSAAIQQNLELEAAE